MTSQSQDDLSKERRALRAGRILGDMARGAFLAGVVLLGPVVLIYLIYLVGTFLPPESKEADDPTPNSFPMLVEQTE
ncbi:MAG: RC-LH1 core complex protein PufX [Pseudomonadota bacterium]